MPSLLYQSFFYDYTADVICFPNKADFKKLYFFTADYPYINYYVINKPREEAGQFYTANKAGQPRIRQLNTSESVSSSNVNLSAKLI